MFYAPRNIDFRRFENYKFHFGQFCISSSCQLFVHCSMTMVAIAMLQHSVHCSTHTLSVNTHIVHIQGVLTILQAQELPLADSSHPSPYFGVHIILRNSTNTHRIQTKVDYFDKFRISALRLCPWIER